MINKTKRTEDMERLWNALLLMKQSHEGQTDKCGQPYWIHPFTVAMECFSNYSRKELSSTIVGLLHDILEDTDVDFEYISERIPLTTEEIKTLLLLTKNKDISYAEYIRAVSKNKIAKKVKKEDLFHNTNTKRFYEANIKMTNKDLDRVNKYYTALISLSEKSEEEPSRYQGGETIPTRSITDDIIIDNPEAVERLVEILEEGEENSCKK